MIFAIQIRCDQRYAQGEDLRVEETSRPRRPGKEAEVAAALAWLVVDAEN